MLKPSYTRIMKEDISKNYKTENPYRVPDGYFQQKQKELLAIADTAPGKGHTKLRALYWSLAGVAAAFLIAVFLWPGRPTPSPTPDFSFSEQEVSEYLISAYPTLLNEDILLEEVTAEELDEEFGESLEDENIEEYLDENYDQSLHYEYL